MHDIGIWLGAYKPRMLRLTGRLADGWVPSLGHASPEELGGMRRRVVEDGAGGWTLADNPAWRPRGAAEVAAILAA